MHCILNLLYDIGMRGYSLAAKIAAPFNDKAKLFCKGRKGLLARIVQTVKSDAPIVWFHASSVGEFEQARPIIEWYKANAPQYRILLTFFSPSGYELRKNYDMADWVFYLPIDTSSNARRFVEAVKPQKAIFIKYEFWYNYLTTLKRFGAEVYIVSAIFRRSQPFFKWYGSLFRKMLGTYSHLFVQDENSAALLAEVGIKENVTISGDTRFDRVYKITKSSNNLPLVDAFVRVGMPSSFAGITPAAQAVTTTKTTNSLILVAGSSWPPDEALIARILENFSKIRLVLAPHEIGKDHLTAIERTFSIYNPVRYTQLNERFVNSAEGSEEREAICKQLSCSRVLIIDCIGILSSIYKYGHVAYIGGGFGVGIHNILEAATYGIPIIFGPNYKKFKEARDLIALGGATSIENCSGLYDITNKFVNNRSVIAEKGAVCKNYVLSNIGATRKVVSTIEKSVGIN